MANTNRKKGHDFERKAAAFFRKLGYMMCKTSRYASRIHDDCGVDLVGLPFNVQCKAGHQRGMVPGNVLRDMDEKMDGVLDVDKYRPNILLWEKPAGRGKKRDKYHTLAIMSMEDLEELFNLLTEDD